MTPDQLIALVRGAAAAALKYRAADPKAGDDEIIYKALEEVRDAIEAAIKGKAIGSA